MMRSMTSIKAQFKLAFKSLQNAPGFVASVLLTMSLTLATAFVVLSLVNTYFIQPLDVMDENRLFVVEQEVDTQTGTDSGFQSYKAIVQWLRTQRSFEKITAVSPSEVNINSLPGEPKVIATYTLSDYFDIFNVPFILGQKFSPDAQFDEPIAKAIISEKLWQQHYNSDPNILGKTIQQADFSYEIIGVVAKSFNPPYMFYQGESDLWLHFGDDRRFFNGGEWDNPWDNTYRSLKLVGTSKPGLSFQDVYNDLDENIEAVRAEWSQAYATSTDFRPLLTGYRKAELGDNGQLSLFLLAGTLGLLLIAVVNVCNLFFSRALAQHKNLALQAVLGAKRRLLFNAIISQTLLLIGASVAIALFLSAWGIKLFKFIAAGQMPLVQSLQIDLNLLIVAIVLGIALAYLFALVTSRLVNYRSLQTQLQSSGKGGVNQVSATMVRILVGTQMALALSLVIFACLALTKTYQTLNRPMGSKIENMYSLIAYVNGESRELSRDERVDNRHRVLNLLSDMPEIKRVTIGQSPVNQQVTKSTLTDQAGKMSQFIPQAWVGAEYFDHTGLKILEGRTFSEAAMRGEKAETLVSQALAYQLDPTGDVIGKIYQGHQPDVEIVGITENFNHPKYYDQDKGAHVWWSVWPSGYAYLVELHPGQTLDQQKLLAQLRKDDERFKIWRLLSLEQEYEQIIYMDVVTLVISTILGGFTLLLAGVGIYGVLSYNLGLKRFEFGLRMALGAKNARMYRLLIKDAIMPLSIGASCAILITFWLYLQHQSALTSWLSFDWMLALAAIGTTFLFALFAAIKPMRNILNGRPMNALRNE